jgi:hypothetical protein
MEKYIYLKSNCIDENTCNYIINVYNKEDIIIPSLPDISSNWYNIVNNILFDKLRINIIEYNNIISSTPIENLIINTYSDSFIQLNMRLSSFDKIQSNYTSDFNIKQNIYSIVSYIWFLDNNDHGSFQIIFWDNYIIKPNKGDLIIFPASWEYPYKIINNKDTFIYIKGILYNTYDEL